MRDPRQARRQRTMRSAYEECEFSVSWCSPSVRWSASSTPATTATPAATAAEATAATAEAAAATAAETAIAAAESAARVHRLAARGAAIAEVSRRIPVADSVKAARLSAPIEARLLAEIAELSALVAKLAAT